MSAVAKIDVAERVCRDCERTKPLAEFAKASATSRYYLRRCIPCHKAKESKRAKDRWLNDPLYRAKRRENSRRVYHSYPERHAGKKRPAGTPHTRDYYVRRLCGVSFDHVQKAFDQQLGRCANSACGIEVSWAAPKGSRNRAVIDHDHATGKFRAVLCHPCNVLLGHVEKSKNRLLGLFEYAVKHTDSPAAL